MYERVRDLEFKPYPTPAKVFKGTLPSVPGIKGNEDEALKDKCISGLKNRYKGAISDAVCDRLFHELDVIKATSNARYLLVLNDLMQYGKGIGVEFGPGRGSSACSIVNYALGITDVDPIKYGLCFERYLNTQGLSEIDIDIDCDEKGRLQLIEYLENTYGDDHVAGIMYYSIKDGAIVNRTKHGAAVVVTDSPVADYAPLVDSDENTLLYDRFDTELSGIQYYDLLTLKALSRKRAFNELLTAEGKKKVDFSQHSYDDPEVYKFIREGDTSSIFLMSEAFKELIKKSNASSLEDISALFAMYRPGPEDKIPGYIANKVNQSNLDEFKNSCPDMYPFLKNTYGILVYQEQIIDSISSLCGCSRELADICRRDLAKKKYEKVNAFKSLFLYGQTAQDGADAIPGCIENGISKDAALEIFEMLYQNAPYAFNKSHSICYVALIYQTAYLKLYYPDEFEEAFVLPEIFGENYMDY